MTVTALQTPAGMFQLLELDIAPFLADGLGADLESAANRPQLEAILCSMIKKLGTSASGVILDPVWSLPATLPAKPTTASLVLRLDKPMATVDPLALPTLMPEWGVEAVRQNYGVAWLSLWYHPQEKLALEKKQLVAELADYCQHEQIALGIKLQITPMAPEGEQPVEASEPRSAQLEAVQELRGFADFLALQYPGDSLSCATLTAELDIPWLVILHHPEYQKNKELLRDALENGAQGSVLGPELWQPLTSLRQADHSPDWKAIDNWIATEGRDRMMELSRITNEYGARSNSLA